MTHAPPPPPQEGRVFGKKMGGVRMETGSTTGESSARKPAKKDWRTIMEESKKRHRPRLKVGRWIVGRPSVKRGCVCGTQASCRMRPSGITPL
jgi:hypothetical protein